MASTQRARLDIAASLMNTVILSTVLSAGNHALFAGTRILYSLAKLKQAPSVFARTSQNGVPWAAILATGSGSALCLATSAVGKGELWFWLQNLVGVSNQACRPVTVRSRAEKYDRLHGFPLASRAGGLGKPGSCKETRSMICYTIPRFPRPGVLHLSYVFSYLAEPILKA
jgi:hypothetical protein